MDTARPKFCMTALMICWCAGGCGAPETADRGTPRPKPAVSKSDVATVTAGRLGEATMATAARPSPALLARGGVLPRRLAVPPRDAEGVGAAASCTKRNLLPSRQNLREIRSATLCLMNLERRRRGLAPLRPHRRLALASSRHSRDMVRRGYFAHETPAGRTLVDRLRAARYIRRGRGWAVGENLAWGSGALATPAAIVRAWMNSPGHRRNLLSAEFHYVGLGIVAGNPRANTGATFTTDFGQRG